MTSIYRMSNFYFYGIRLATLLKVSTRKEFMSFSCSFFSKSNTDHYNALISLSDLNMCGMYAQSITLSLKKKIKVTLQVTT